MAMGQAMKTRDGMQRRDGVRLIWGHDLPMLWD